MFHGIPNFWASAQVFPIQDTPYPSDMCQRILSVWEIPVYLSIFNSSVIISLRPFISTSYPPSPGFQLYTRYSTHRVTVFVHIYFMTVFSTGLWVPQGQGLYLVYLCIPLPSQIKPLINDCWVFITTSLPKSLYRREYGQQWHDSAKLTKADRVWVEWVQAVALTLGKSLPHSGPQFPFLSEEGNSTFYKLPSKLPLMLSIPQHQDFETMEQLYKLCPNWDVRSVVPRSPLETDLDLVSGAGDSQV